MDAEKLYNYKTVNSTDLSGMSFADHCNHYAEMGWRVVAVISDTRSGYAHGIVLERPVGVSHPND